jgi:GT2 family glycosyltransferase
MKKISVVIATYHRPDFLSGLLDALSLQTLSPKDFEVVVVDNSRIQDVRVQEICRDKKYSAMDIKYCHQPVIGLSNARNMGFTRASGEWIGYIDDDAIPPSTWLEKALDRIQTCRTDIIGGSIHPTYSVQPPAWFHDEYAGSNDKGVREGFTQGKVHLYGANMFWKRKLLEELGGFSPEFGYIGDKKIFGDETELGSRAMKHGARIWYVPDLFIKHNFPKAHMHAGWFFADAYRHGQSKALIQNQDWNSTDHRSPFRQFLSQWKEFSSSFFALATSFFIIPFRNRKQFPFWQNYAVEVITPRVYKLGQEVIMVKVSSGKLVRKNPAGSVYAPSTGLSERNKTRR